ncbi:hypothetical protein [Sphingomonas sp.]
MRWSIGVTAAATILVGCASTPERQAEQAARAKADLARTLAGRVAGKPQTCLPVDLRDGPRIIAPDTLIYGETRGRLWLVRAKGCPFLRNDDIVITEVFGGRLCRNDLFRTLPRTGGIPSPVCRFGEFTPWQRAD